MHILGRTGNPFARLASQLQGRFIPLHPERVKRPKHMSYLRLDGAHGHSVRDANVQETRRRIDDRCRRRWRFPILRSHGSGNPIDRHAVLTALIGVDHAAIFTRHVEKDVVRRNRDIMPVRTLGKRTRRPDLCQRSIGVD